ncbi:MAG: preprotein translocase subunit YajC [Pyrinomonadaceae bacterium]
MNICVIFFQGGSGSLIWSLLPFVLIFGIFYFLVIMPQKRKQEEAKEMISMLKINDEVITNGGLIGTIKEVRATSFIIKSADKTLLEIAKSAVIGRKPEEETNSTKL